MKYIRRVSKVKNDDTKGYIINSTNVEDKEKNTYSANIVDGLVVESAKKSIVQVGYNGSSAFKTTTDGKTLVPLAKKLLNFGDGFTILDNGTIKVNKTMYIRAEAQIMLTTSGGGDKVLMIDFNQYDWSYDRVYSLKDYVTLKSDTYIIEAKAGDILSLYYQGDVNDVFHTSNAFVYMYVEEMKV